MAKIRASVAVLGGISILFLGLNALGEAAQQSESTAINQSNATHDAWNLSTDFYTAFGQTTGDIAAWGGAAAFVLITLGLLYYTTQQGGR